MRAFIYFVNFRHKAKAFLHPVSSRQKVRYACKSSKQKQPELRKKCGPIDLDKPSFGKILRRLVA